VVRYTRSIIVYLMHYLGQHYDCVTFIFFFCVGSFFVYIQVKTRSWYNDDFLRFAIIVPNRVRLFLLLLLHRRLTSESSSSLT